MKIQDTVSPLVDLLNQQKLLQLEYQHEKETFYQQTQKSGIPKKIRKGVCWYPVTTGKSYYNSLNQLVIEIIRQPDEENDHQFEHGRPVCFFVSEDGIRLRYLNFSATISYVEEERMMVVLPHSGVLAEIEQKAGLGVQLFFDASSYEIMFTALKEVMAAKESRLIHLRETLLGNMMPSEREIPFTGLSWLNPSQEKAVNNVLKAREVAVIHGPPGTGKTTTLVEAVYETLRRESQVMVCAQSNTAVDWIAEKLLDRGIAVLRIGNPTRVNEKMLSFTYEKKFAAHPSYPSLQNARKAVRGLTGRIRQLKGVQKEQARSRLLKLKHLIIDLELRIGNQLFSESRVIACTLIGSANKLLNGKHFSTLFIDEAAQALEAACWVAISKSDRVILAGDPCQLPPTVKCYEAIKGGLDKTLIQRLKIRKPGCVSMLDVQYRMHEDIMRFPSFWFYLNLLKAAPEVNHRTILEWDTPINWYDTSGMGFHENTASESFGRINYAEAEQMVLQLQHYITSLGKERVLDERISFGIISPYRLQVYYIRQLIKRNHFFHPFRKLLTIHTIDGFQGQERDVIFISMVRSNEKGDIGFLSDLRRMNVAITRARMKLIIWGDASTLIRHPFYKAFYAYVKKNGKVIEPEIE